MIVNTAYIYMGAGGPVNPVIFQRNEINYNYSGTNFTETTDGDLALPGNSEIVFTGIDLSNFEKLTVRANNRASGDVYLTVNFIDNSGNVSADIRQRFDNNSLMSRQYTIPPEYRKPKTKIKLSSTNGRNILLQSAILS